MAFESTIARAFHSHLQPPGCGSKKRSGCVNFGCPVIALERLPLHGAHIILKHALKHSARGPFRSHPCLLVVAGSDRQVCGHLAAHLCLCSHWLRALHSKYVPGELWHLVSPWKFE